MTTGILEILTVGNVFADRSFHSVFDGVHFRETAAGVDPFLGHAVLATFLQSRAIVVRKKISDKHFHGTQIADFRSN